MLIASNVLRIILTVMESSVLMLSLLGHLPRIISLAHYALLLTARSGRIIMIRYFRVRASTFPGIVVPVVSVVVATVLFACGVFWTQLRVFAPKADLCSLRMVQRISMEMNSGCWE